MIDILLALMQALSPAQSQATEESEETRYAIAVAIEHATTDEHERRLLVSIAAWESGYRARVADCTVRGDGGRALGPWQVHARSARERAEVCASLDVAARVALEHVRTSLRVCAGNRDAEKLAAYTSGSCNNSAGKRLSRERWIE